MPMKLLMIAAESGTRTAPPTRCTFSIMSRRYLPRDRTRDALDAGAQYRREIDVASPLAPFGFLDRDAQRTSENEVEVVATARRVAQRHNLAILHDADARRSAANVHDGAVANVHEGLRGGDFINQTTASDAGIL